jgi:hypothetical protein
LNFRIKPACNNENIILQINPTLRVLDAKTKSEKFKFQSDTSFQFSGLHSSHFLKNLVFQLMSIAVNEFNTALQETKSTFAIGRKLTMPEFKDLAEVIEQALSVNYEKLSGVIPHW